MIIKINEGKQKQGMSSVALYIIFYYNSVFGVSYGKQPKQEEQQ